MRESNFPVSAPPAICHRYVVPYSVVPPFVSIRFIRGHFRVFRLFRGFSTSSHWQSRYRHFLRILWFSLTASFCRPTSHRIKKRHLTMRDAVSERRFKLLIQQQELLLPQQEQPSPIRGRTFLQRRHVFRLT